MKTHTIIALIGTLAAGSMASAQNSTYVPATANPWFANMPDGFEVTFNGVTDRTPDSSPVLMRLPIADEIQISAFGEASNGPARPVSGPDGRADRIVHYEATVFNGMSDVHAPIASLLGAFVHATSGRGESVSMLDFSTPESRDYLSIEPVFNQVFFIGDGRTSEGEIQSIVVPEGATHLVLGVLDGYEFGNNPGGFLVTMVPSPGSAVLIGLAGAMTLRRRR